MLILPPPFLAAAAAVAIYAKTMAENELPAYLLGGHLFNTLNAVLLAMIVLMVPLLTRLSILGGVFDYFSMASPQKPQ